MEKTLELSNRIESTIANNLTRVQERIKAACNLSGRAESEVVLVVVTKGHPLSMVQSVIQAGGTHLGENYVEEAQAKIAACQGYSHLHWHMIGHVQGRKARPVCELFSWVHSVDRLNLAERLDRFAAGLDRQLQVLLECNMSGEETKYGWKLWDENAWRDFIPIVQRLQALPHLSIRGLMTMAPLYDEPEKARPVFRKLRHLQAFLRRQVPNVSWDELSMGMSNDFEVAIQEGATMIRVGTAILGPRPTSF